MTEPTVVPPGAPSNDRGTSMSAVLEIRSATTAGPESIDRLKHEHASIDAWCRHDDTMIYTSAATFLPLTFGALAFALQWPKVRLALAFFSLSLYVYWLALSIRLSWFSTARLRRAAEVEERLGISHHRYVSAPPEELTQRLGAKISIRRLRFWMLGLLSAAWIAIFWAG